ncbi:hypothetical protein CYY_002511 [Polysphondylium violaceum]|uniref:Protein kinase domain-containing protein n=1 Tax=Polysphondylium violaceum TaxID=133409 RepID=A0A8J4PW60_9MYCE|nr:hypothetical protein CYY_002511 [Polysphondylium violaceum]
MSHSWTLKSLETHNLVREVVGGTIPILLPHTIHDDWEGNTKTGKDLQNKHNLQTATTTNITTSSNVDLFNQLPIGEGHSKVYSGLWKQGMVAIKKFNYSQFQSFKDECRIHSQLCHPNILTYIDAIECHDRKCYCIITEKMDCSLELFMKSNPNIFISNPSLMLHFCLEIAKGMKYLHDCLPEKEPILHRDLSMKNILLKGPSLKIADYGLSLFEKEQPQTLFSDVSFLKYQAQEIKMNTGTYSKKSDVYAFGIIFHEFLTYHGVVDNDINMMHYVSNETLVAPLWASKESASILLKCVDKEPSKRPTFQEIIDHFEEMDQHMISPFVPNTQPINFDGFFNAMHE